MTQKFEMGRLVATPGALSAMGNTANIVIYVNRHLQGDWGDIVDEDAKRNDQALKDGERLMSVYKNVGENNDVTLWIITEWDRSVTTALLPSEY